MLQQEISKILLLASLSFFSRIVLYRAYIDALVTSYDSTLCRILDKHEPEQEKIINIQISIGASPMTWGKKRREGDDLKKGGGEQNQLVIETNLFNKNLG